MANLGDTFGKRNKERLEKGSGAERQPEELLWEAEKEIDEETTLKVQRK